MSRTKSGERQAGMRHGPADHPIAWPVLVIDRDDRFVHVLTEDGGHAHIDDPEPPSDLALAFAPLSEPAPAPDSPDPVAVDFFDRDGRRLRPVVGTDFSFLGLEATPILVPTDELMVRLTTALKRVTKQIDKQGANVAVTPGRPTDDFGSYLDELVIVFGEVRLTTGSSFHNFIHLLT